jgi:hypothetical protein
VLLLNWTLLIDPGPAKLKFPTYISVPAELMATPAAPAEVVIVADTSFVARSMTETLLDPELPTYAFAPSGLIATPQGCIPTVTNPLNSGVTPSDAAEYPVQVVPSNARTFK